MKYKIIGTTIVVLILIVLYVLFSGGQSEAVPEEGVAEEQVVQ